MIVLGIDPGANTGLALFRGGRLVGLRTVEPLLLIDALRQVCPDIVVMEDSRLQGAVWHKSPGAIKIARDVGRIDGWCDLIEAACTHMGTDLIKISPKDKGAKLSADQFRQVTGWVERTNAHERDAAMVAWGLRNAACTS